MTYPDYPGANEKLRKTHKDKPRVIDEIKQWAERCEQEGIAIMVFANGTWQQIGGRHQLYAFEDYEGKNKRELMETIRMYKMEKEKHAK